jgi:hypothetical protein
MLMNVEAPRVLQSYGNLLEGRNDIFCPVYSTLNRTRGNPTKANGTLINRHQDHYQNLYAKLLPRQQRQKCLLVEIKCN